MAFDSALRPTQAAGYSTPLLPELRATNPQLWLQGASVVPQYQAYSSAGLGIVDTSQVASSCSCLGLATGDICGHQLFSVVAWVSSSPIGLFDATSSRLKDEVAADAGYGNHSMYNQYIDREISHVCVPA
jgi:hypothetical protein